MSKIWWVSHKQLDADQKRSISLPKEGVYLIQGPPGSGKTNLLLLRAAYLAKSGYPNCKLLVFNTELRDFLRAGTEHYSLPSDLIQTSQFFFKKILADHDPSKIPEPRENSTFSEDRKRLAEAVSAYLETERIENLFDALFIDEVQDYSADEINLFLRLAPNIFAVGDNNQRIYEPEGAVSLLESRADQVIQLNYHYRTGLNICKLCDEIFSSRIGHTKASEFCNYDETESPSRVTVEENLPLADQIAAAIESLDKMLKAYPGEYFSILTPRNEELQIINDTLLSSGISQLIKKKGDAFSPTTPIVTSTIHGAKGLEFRATFVLSADTLRKFRDRQRNLAFTAFSRPRSLLAIYFASSYLPFIKSAHTNATLSERDVSIESLFPKENE